MRSVSTTGLNGRITVQVRACSRNPAGVQPDALQPSCSYAGARSSRRQLLGSALGCLTAAALANPAPTLAAPPLPDGSNVAAAAATVRALQEQALEQQAAQAYAERNFDAALGALDELLERDPRSLRWREMRAQARVDGKQFAPALADFEVALKQLPAEGAEVDRARLLAGKGLALEGLGDWAAALDTYTAALEVAAAAGQLPDPYVLNSRGNCRASLGQWAAARADFQASAEGFQRAAGFRRGRSTTPRLDGAVYAASNAALMLAQMGDEEGAMREMQAVARRAPGSVDMRAALAALYWQRGQEAAAEAEWDWACQRITAGCSKYQDQDWLRRIRRWPPLMCDYLRDFLQLRSSPAAGGGGGGGGSQQAAFRE